MGLGVSLARPVARAVGVCRRGEGSLLIPFRVTFSVVLPEFRFSVLQRQGTKSSVPPVAGHTGQPEQPAITETLCTQRWTEENTRRSVVLP